MAAFLADIFGPDNVGSIYGVVLTAWSAAAVAGPTIITTLSNTAKAALAPGASRVHIYDLPLEVLAGGLAWGLCSPAGPAVGALYKGGLDSLWQKSLAGRSLRHKLLELATQLSGRFCRAHGRSRLTRGP